MQLTVIILLVELLLVFGDFSKLEKLPLLITFLVVLSSVDAPFFLFLVGVVCLSVLIMCLWVTSVSETISVTHRGIFSYLENLSSLL